MYIRVGNIKQQNLQYDAGGHRSMWVAARGSRRLTPRYEYLLVMYMVVACRMYRYRTVQRHREGPDCSGVLRLLVSPEAVFSSQTFAAAARLSLGLSLQQRPSMGCGASIFGGTRARKGLRHQLQTHRTELVTPPEGTTRGAGGGGNRLGGGKSGLRIDAKSAASRSDVGIAETPVGKQAEVFKYYCPLCMCAPPGHALLGCVCQH